ncbi:putative iron transport transcriptional regulator [Escherichia coli]|uniref:Putative iron transport transcriptional regulator n=1 Tax=Escherichia coli TaxID=562 RepID=A0A376LE54_ECOLX|nr:putative iron transport transcriptional regulator [Escherichia coli]
MMAQKSAHREGLTTLREARRLGIPVILLTNALDSRFSKDASIVIHVPRGMKKGKRRYMVRYCCGLEMIVWSVASAVPQRAVKTIKRINDFHRGLKTGRKNG